MSQQQQPQPIAGQQRQQMHPQMQMSQQTMGQGFPPQQMMGQQQQPGNAMQQQMMVGGMMGNYQRKPNNVQMQNFPQQLQMLNNINMQQPPRPKPDYDNKLCLYIGNLTTTTFDNDLFKFFKNKGYSLRNAQVMLNQDTRKSKCFGYLNFYTEAEANRCLHEMNNANLNGKQVVLNKKKSQNFDTQANIIIRNIPKEMAQSDLFELCKPFGKIVSCKLETLPNGTSKGFCYVQYEKAEQAQEAINGLNKTTQMGKEIQVLVHSKKAEREEQPEQFTNLYVKNIPSDFTEAQLKEVFEPFGEITSVAKKGTSSDQGYVMFKTHEQARAAIEELNAKKQINGKTIFVSKFISSSENEQNSSKAPPISQQLSQTFKSNIFVKNIPKEITEEQFKEKMSKAGVVISHKLKNYYIEGEDGQRTVLSKNGFVCFETVEEAQKCIQMFDQTHVFGFGFKTLKVQFWKSQYDLNHDNEESNINQVKKFIHYIKYEMKQSNNMMGRGYPYQQNYRGSDNGNNKFNNKRGGARGGGGRGQGRGGYKNYNQPDHQKQFQSQGGSVGATPNPNQKQATPGAGQAQLQLPPIDLNDLEKNEGQERNNFVGNTIFPVIQLVYGPENAPRITGMLLDENAVNFKQLLSDNEYFRSKVNEAYSLLMTSLNNGADQQQQQQ